MNRKIMWESWNVKEDELIHSKTVENKNLLSKLTKPDVSYETDIDNDMDNVILDMAVPYITTPFGTYNVDCIFRPAERWSCWIAHTNFKIGPKAFKILNEDTAGVEALSVMGSYTFCIGIAKMFDPNSVRKSIEEKLCGEINVQKFDDGGST